MMIRKTVVCLLAMLISLSATAGGVRIDGSSNDTVTNSIQAMYAEHGNREKCLLMTAIVRIQAADQEQKAAATGDKSAVADPLGPKINGMSYEEILAFSETFPAKAIGLCRN